MIPYAAHVTTKKQRDFLLSHGWRMMVTPVANAYREPFAYAIDNGAWGAFVSGQPFDRIAFLRLVEEAAQNADFIVIPDIVGGGLDSLDFSETWVNELKRYGAPLYLAVQDGMSVREVRSWLNRYPYVAGLFVGGTSEWKDRTIPIWSQLSRSMRIACHVGRVNSKRRMRLCAACGVDSFDGSGASKWLKHAEKMVAWGQQRSLLLGA